MKITKTEYLFKDLPCLIVEPMDTKRKYSVKKWPHYYGEDIETVAYGLQKRFKK